MALVTFVDGPEASDPAPPPATLPGRPPPLVLETELLRLARGEFVYGSEGDDERDGGFGPRGLPGRGRGRGIEWVSRRDIAPLERTWKILTVVPSPSAAARREPEGEIERHEMLEIVPMTEGDGIGEERRDEVDEMLKGKWARRKGVGDSSADGNCDPSRRGCRS